MDSINNIDDAITKICVSSNKSNEEVKQLIEAKKEKFSGLLTDSGAAFMIAKELGVELEKQNSTECTKISSLQEGMNNVDVTARIKKIFSPREFDKNGKKGMLQNVVFWDNTGEIRATFWNNDVEKLKNINAQIGTCLKLSNCAVGAYNNVLQLNLNYNSDFLIEENSNIPKLEQEIIEISDLDSGMNDVCLIGEIKRIFPIRAFETEKGAGKVINFIFGQGVEETKATAWNNMADEIEGFAPGDKIKIEGAYTKDGMNGIELHLGWNARITSNE